MADIEVRRATPADAGAVARRLAMSWRDAYADLLPDEVLNARDTVRDTAELRTLFSAGPPSGGIVVVRDSGVVGFATFGPPGVGDAAGLVEIYAMYVDPSESGSGAGFRLLLRTIREARRSGASGLVWYVHRHNQAVRRMVERRVEPTGDPLGRSWYGHPVEVMEYRYEW